MAMFHGIQDLEEGSLDLIVVAHVPTPFSDIGKEITLGTVFQNNVGAVWIVHNLEHRHYVRVCGRRIMEPYFPGLEFSLPAVQRVTIGRRFTEGLDRIPRMGEMVDCRIYHAIGARS